MIRKGLPSAGEEERQSSKQQGIYPLRRNVEVSTRKSLVVGLSIVQGFDLGEIELREVERRIHTHHNQQSIPTLSFSAFLIGSFTLVSS